MSRHRSQPTSDVSAEHEPGRDVFRGEIAVRVAEADGVRGEPTSDDMRLINRLAQTRLKPEDVFVFDCLPSNNQLDSYSTRMAKSSLRNYAKDAKAGVALMNSHATSRFGGMELPIGRSYRGELVEDGDVTTFRSAAYMLRGQTISKASNDDLIRGIEAGTIFDISIGFRGGWFKCGICNNPLFSRDCSHFPGWPTEDGETAWAWVEDANLGEYSLVYDGATPGAVITKATRLAAEGQLSPSDIVLAEEVLRARIRPISVVPMPAVRIATSAAVELVDVDPELNPPRANPNERTADMTGAETIAAVLSGQSTALTPEVRQRLEGLQQQLTTTSGTAAEAVLAVLELAPAAAAGGDNASDIDALRQRLVTLEAEAVDGRAYRTQLITDTLAWGVRAHGNDFRREMYERMFKEPGRSLDDIRAVQDDFKAAAEALLGPGGRQTVAQDPNDPSGLGTTTTTATKPRDMSHYAAP